MSCATMPLPASWQNRPMVGDLTWIFKGIDWNKSHKMLSLRHETGKEGYKISDRDTKF